MKLRSPTGKPIKIKSVKPNAGLRAAYQMKLDALIDEMQASIVYWLKAAYRANAPEMAQDASPAAAMRAAMRKLSRRWQKRFDESSLDLARYFALNAQDRSDAMLKAILKKSGFSVEFKMTAEANDVMQATIGEQVGLIRSIAEEHLTQVQGLVMRSVQEGRDLGTLSKDLQARYGVTKRRAALIARDQNNKATASMNRVRQDALGITEAVWRHSGAGKHPRPSHVAADGKKYDVKKGMFLDGEWSWPGTAINCRCTSESVIPGWDD